MYGLTLITPPASEPVSVATLRTHLRLNTTDEDSLLAGHIQSARELFESMTDRSCLTTTWKISMDAFPRIIRLPRAPLQSVSSVTYYDSNDTLVTWDASKYSVDTAREPGRITPVVWFPDWKIFPVFPPLSYKRAAKVFVQFVSGWTTDTIPASVKQAIMLQAASYYENRSSDGELCEGFKRVVNMHKLAWITDMNRPQTANYGYIVE